MNDKAPKMPEGQKIDLDVLEKYKEIFLKQEEHKGFEKCPKPGNGRFEEEKRKKKIISDYREKCVGIDDEKILGKEVIEILKGEELIDWRCISKIDGMPLEQRDKFNFAIGRLVRSNDTKAALVRAFSDLLEINEKPQALQFGERNNIIFSARSVSHPNESTPIQINYINKIWEDFTGRKLLIDNDSFNMGDVYNDYSNFFGVLFDKFTDWGWEPEDWIDVQCYLWALKGREETDNVEDGPLSDKEPKTMNMILYGPPGTGKTYATASEALKLCGESVPDNPKDLMELYRKLLERGRIEFVTFHQSMSYEDFVEGRQPRTGSEDDGDAASAGFRLETEPGIFRRIAKRAEASKGHSSENFTLNEEQRVFKMSIGNSNDPDEAHLFNDAINDGYAILGFDDIDWSPEKYAEKEAILKKVQEENRNDSVKVTRNSAKLKAPYTFRNRVRVGDIVVVTKGNGLFRAIGKFSGDYEFHPRLIPDYSHKRKVDWFWVESGGVPASEIYSKRFTQLSIYQLEKSDLKIPALEHYVNSGQAYGSESPEPFVLIIDEINRANISKVFGELITLLETDKRIGMPNEIKVRLPYSGDMFGVPPNLYIIGTMNTADRSIALLDTALRRRFVFREMMPDPDMLDKNVGGIDLCCLLKVINERVEYLYDREHQIGHSYFLDCKSKAHVDYVMRHKVIPLLAEYFFDDWAKVAAVLGDADSDEYDGSFLKCTKLNAPPGYNNERFRWELRTEFNYREFLSK